MSCGAGQAGDNQGLTAFAGEDINAAVFYPEDDAFLVDRERTVSRFDVG